MWRQRHVKGGRAVDSYEEYEDNGRRPDQESLRARSEQALGEIAQALIDNPTLHNAITAAFGAREKAIEAQHAAFSALNLPSASDVERLERRLRSFSQRLEEAEEQLDDANRELGVLRRRLAEQEAKLGEQAEKIEKKPAKKAKTPAKATVEKSESDEN
jgi:TolA-binding protein